MGDWMGHVFNRRKKGNPTKQKALTAHFARYRSCTMPKGARCTGLKVTGYLKT
jgi:hypothetical protein